MEVFMIKSRFQQYAPSNLTKLPPSVPGDLNLALDHQLNSSSHSPPRSKPPSDMDLNATTEGLLYADNSTSLLLWNDSSVMFNLSGNGSEDYPGLDYESPTKNGSDWEPSWEFCSEWTAAQHTMFQAANLFFAAAFLVPMSFKQSVLVVRALLTFGFLFSAIWAGGEVCALDVLLWDALLAAVNFTHSAQLTWKFLPPTLTLEMTDLYIKVFKPLKVSKKHFKELVREAHVACLEQGDIYAVEDVSPADERLSILLQGKAVGSSAPSCLTLFLFQRLRVTCDDTHLHFISSHQFVDSPEWEANHEQSDDVFQVTITAEENSVYLCWPRMKLERVLRHRPALKTVLDSIIGKDITQKLYSLNEHLTGMIDDIAEDRRRNDFRNLHARSLSLDAVNTGTTGRVRSVFFKANQRKPSFSSSGYGSPARAHNQCWMPVVANHFPPESPFTSPPATAYLLPSETEDSPLPTLKNSSKSNKRNREVTFVNEVEKVSYQNKIK